MRPTVSFLGWFGPRGLASMLFGLLIVSEGDVDNPDELFSVITVVIMLSVFLHGLSASPGASRYGRWFSANDDDEMSESEMVPESPVRWNRSRTWTPHR